MGLYLGRLAPKGRLYIFGDHKSNLDIKHIDCDIGARKDICYDGFNTDPLKIIEARRDPWHGQMA